jgi:hypothetical protein
MDRQEKNLHWISKWKKKKYCQNIVTENVDMKNSGPNKLTIVLSIKKTVQAMKILRSMHLHSKRNYNQVTCVHDDAKGKQQIWLTLDLGTFPLIVTYLLAFSLATFIRWEATIFGINKLRFEINNGKDDSWIARSNAKRTALSVSNAERPGQWDREIE